MFSFIKNKIKQIFSKETFDETFLKELEKLLITADAGVKTTKKIIDALQNDITSQKITDLQTAKKTLENLLISQLESYKAQETLPNVLLLVGINGSGKTSFAAKFAHALKKQNKKILLVAADTFRAAAVEQLNEWARTIDIPIFIGKQNQDPASVIFDACKKYKEENFDHIIIDTAGRLQTKINLMKELE
jgi:fused signal recognition particle receptor